MISTDCVLKSRMFCGYCAGKMKIPALRTYLYYGLHFSGHQERDGRKRGRSMRVDELWAPVTQTALPTWADTPPDLWGHNQHCCNFILT